MAYQNLDLYILETIAGVMAKYKQKYCVISQNKFLKLLENFYNVKISKRTLNYHLKKLEKQRYIKRERRIKRNPNGTLKTLPTCYFLQEKAYGFIFKTVAIFERFLKNTTEMQKFANNYYLDPYNYIFNTNRIEKKEKKKNLQPAKSKNISYSPSIKPNKKTYKEANLVSQELQSGFNSQESYLERLKKKFAQQREKRLTELTDDKRQKILEIFFNNKKTMDFEDRKNQLLKQSQILKQLGI